MIFEHLQHHLTSILFFLSDMQQNDQCHISAQIQHLAVLTSIYHKWVDFFIWQQ